MESDEHRVKNSAALQAIGANDMYFVAKKLGKFHTHYKFKS